MQKTIVGEELAGVLFCQRKTRFVVQRGSVSIQEQGLSHGTLLAWEPPAKGAILI